MAKNDEKKWSWRWTKWTNAKWAECLGCDTNEVAAIKKFIKKNYYYTVFRDKNNQCGFCIYRLGRYPDGDPRPMLEVSLSERVRTNSPEELKCLIEEVIFPNIEFSSARAELLGVPPKSLRLVFS